MDREGLSRYSRRDFLKFAGLAGGALLLSDELLAAALIDKRPLKSRAEAVIDFNARHRSTLRFNPSGIPVIDQIRATELITSSVGMANIPFWGYEIPEKIHTTFAIDPNSFEVSTPLYRFLALTNSASEDKLFRPPRKNETYRRMMEELFDTGVWIANSDSRGRNGDVAVVVEVGDKDPAEKLCDIAELLYSYGFIIQIYGNEFDLPGSQNWQVKPDLIKYALAIINRCVSEKGLFGTKLAHAAPAYYGYPGFRQEPELREIAPLIQIISRHLYPPVNDDENGREEKGGRRLNPGIETLLDYEGQILRRNGWWDKELIIREVGFPGADHPNTQFRLDQLAEGHVPAVLMLTIGSKIVRRVYWYNFYSPGQDYQSLASFVDGKWVLKPTYEAWEFTAKLLGMLRDIEVYSKREYSLVKGRRWDGIEFVTGWANGTRTVILQKDPDAVLINAYGRPIYTNNMALYRSDAPPNITGPVVTMAKFGPLELPKAA